MRLRGIKAYSVSIPFKEHSQFLETSSEDLWFVAIEVSDYKGCIGYCIGRKHFYVGRAMEYKTLIGYIARKELTNIEFESPKDLHRIKNY